MSQNNLMMLRKIERQKQRKLLLRQPGLLVCILLTAAVLIIFSIYPMIEIFIQTVYDGTGFDFSVIQKVFGKQSFWRSFGNSVLLGLCVAVISSLIGFVFAFAITRTSLPGKKFFHLIAMLPIVSPPFVMALSLILLFGRSGIITRSLLGITNNNVYGMGSLIVAQTLALYPLAYLNMKGVLESINTAVEDAAHSLGASRGHIFRTVTLPLCLPALLSSLLLVFMKSISDFGNPQLLAGDFTTLSSQAYLQINGRYDLRSGALIAISILLPSVLAFVIQKYWVGKKSFVSVTGKPTSSSGLIREKYIVIPLFIICALLVGAVLLFYSTVIWISLVKTWGADMTLSFDNFRFAFARGGVYIRDSFLLALISAPITAIFGMIIAFLVVRKTFIGKKLIEFGSMVTFAVPGIVMGIGYIMAFNKAPFYLTGTAFIIVIALVFRNMSVGIEAGTNSLRQIDVSIEEASASLGANSFTTFLRVTLPLIRSALYTSLVNSFVRSMTSISAVIFLVSVNWNLLTVLIMSEVENSRFGMAAAYCVILMAIVLIMFGILSLLTSRIGSRRKDVL